MVTYTFTGLELAIVVLSCIVGGATGMFFGLWMFATVRDGRRAAERRQAEALRRLGVDVAREQDEELAKMRERGDAA